MRQRAMRWLAGLLVLAALAGVRTPAAGDDVEGDLNRIAERYVTLVLAVGVHDPAYVDAYYGPAEWKEAVESEAPSLGAIKSSASELSERLGAMDVTGLDAMLVLRYRYLDRQLGALAARVELLGGKKMSFDDESKALYDAVAPTHPESDFKKTLAALDEKLPGEGELPARLADFRSGFVIPRDKLDAVFKAALDESRKRTKAHINLPRDERFEIEYVTDKPWSGYNWYKGGGYSLIQLNTDHPIYISRAIDLACHEGYPGHHVYNVLLESELVDKRKWMEYCVYPLFSPQSLIAEGSANFGIEVAFTAAERIRFERDVLFPIAGIDPSKAELYYEVQDLLDNLSYAGNEAARRYLNGEISRDEAAEWLVEYALMTPERAEQRVDFFDTYRSYVINYNLGKDLVRSYIESRGGTDDDPEKRWKEFARLISSPRLPSGLQ